MVALRSLARRAAAVDRRVLVPGVVALVVAVVGVAYGIVADDAVTALGALLFVPSAALLVGIALRRDRGVETRERRRIG
ncbi:hypothetical protein [Halorubrum sp. SY-15]|uniref:hypothetical protein n=1 Tax=Halorubrum sp. SY-15 TaxID=3402277 RepID=UPI003EC052B1